MHLTVKLTLIQDKPPRVERINVVGLDRRIPKGWMNDVHPNTVSSKDQECDAASLAISRLTFPVSGSSRLRLGRAKQNKALFLAVVRARRFLLPRNRAVWRMRRDESNPTSYYTSDTVAIRDSAARFSFLHFANCSLEIFTPVAKRVAEPLVEPRFNIGPYHASGGAGRKLSSCFVMAQCSLSSAVRELWLNYCQTVL